MTALAGTTRNVVTRHYVLLTPDGFVPGTLAGWEKAVCHVLTSPALGARFAQLLITLDRDGQCAGNPGVNQYFIFLFEGAASILLESRKHRLEPGSYAYLPTGQDVQIASAAAATRLLVFQKPYHPLPGTPKPAGFVAHERDARAQPLPGGEAARAQALLPAHPAFDMAVNLLTFEPGATAPAVESPPAERGWRILRGQGIYRLGRDWHPVQAGDVIWTAPYCPQWFVAIGKVPASCICYHEAHRDPV